MVYGMTSAKDRLGLELQVWLNRTNKITIFEEMG